MTNNLILYRSSLCKIIRKMAFNGELQQVPLMLTKSILTSLKYDVGMFKEVTSYVYFGIEDLIIPTSQTYDKDIWLIQCSLNKDQRTRVYSDIYYLDSIKKRMLKHYHGMEYLDERSFEVYKNQRRKATNISNGPIFLKKFEDLKNTIIEIIQSCPKIDFEEYLAIDKNISVYKNTNGSYIVEGDIILLGPYSFEFPKNTVINGDIYIYDFVHQVWPKDMTLNGSIHVKSSYF